MPMWKLSSKAIYDNVAAFSCLLLVYMKPPPLARHCIKCSDNESWLSLLWEAVIKFMSRVADGRQSARWRVALFGSRADRRIGAVGGRLLVGVAGGVQGLGSVCTDRNLSRRHAGRQWCCLL